MANSNDDIFFRPSIEARRVRQLAGCYTVDLGWWDDFTGDRLYLDTTSVGLGAFALRPQLQRFDFRPSWEVDMRDSVRIEWAEVHAIATIRARAHGDSLIGVARVPPNHRERPVTAYRTDCLAPEGAP